MKSSTIRTALVIGLGLVLLGLAGAAVWQLRERSAGRSELRITPANVDNSDTFEEMNLIIPADQIERLKQRATRGDNEAANRLGGHYSQLGQPDDEARWLTLAANRGDCASMSGLRARAESAGDGPGASRWNDRLRQHACTWGKTYPLVSDPRLDQMPLWNEQ